MAEGNSVKVVIVTAGVSDPSTTRMLAERLGHAVLERIGQTGLAPVASIIDLAPIATDIVRALVSSADAESVQRAVAQVAEADALIVSTPVYKAGISGLLKAFFDVLDNDLIVSKPVLLAGTAGSARHAMVIDEHLRSLFAFFRAIPAPTAVFAAPEDWADPALGRRIDRAATELVQLVHTGVGGRIAGEAWHAYTHEFGGNATRAQRTGSDVDLDTHLMRLAAGGRSRDGERS